MTISDNLYNIFKMRISLYCALSLAAIAATSGAVSVEHSAYDPFTDLEDSIFSQIETQGEKAQQMVKIMKNPETSAKGSLSTLKGNAGSCLPGPNTEINLRNRAIAAISDINKGVRALQDAEKVGLQMHEHKAQHMGMPMAAPMVNGALSTSPGCGGMSNLMKTPSPPMNRGALGSPGCGGMPQQMPASALQVGKNIGTQLRQTLSNSEKERTQARSLISQGCGCPAQQQRMTNCCQESRPSMQALLEQSHQSQRAQQQQMIDQAHIMNQNFQNQQQALQAKIAEGQKNVENCQKKLDAAKKMTDAKKTANGVAAKVQQVKDAAVAKNALDRQLMKLKQEILEKQHKLDMKKLNEAENEQQCHETEKHKLELEIRGLKKNLEKVNLEVVNHQKTEDCAIGGFKKATKMLKEEKQKEVELTKTVTQDLKKASELLKEEKAKQAELEKQLEETKKSSGETDKKQPHQCPLNVTNKSKEEKSDDVVVIKDDSEKKDAPPKKEFEFNSESGKTVKVTNITVKDGKVDFDVDVDGEKKDEKPVIEIRD